MLSLHCFFFFFLSRSIFFSRYKLFFLKDSELPQLAAAWSAARRVIKPLKFSRQVREWLQTHRDYGMMSRGRFSVGPKKRGQTARTVQGNKQIITLISVNKCKATKNSWGTQREIKKATRKQRRTRVLNTMNRQRAIWGKIHKGGRKTQVEHTHTHTHRRSTLVITGARAEQGRTRGISK